MCRWQSAQGWSLQHEDHQHNWSRNTQALQTVESVPGVLVTTTKQCGTFMINCHLIVEDLAASVKDHEVPPAAFATPVLRGLRRTLEEIIGAVGAVEAGPTVEEECPAQRHAYESGQGHYDESTGLPLDLQMVADAVKEELLTNKGDAATPFVRARLVAQETERVNEHVLVVTPLLDSLKFMLSRCMIFYDISRAHSHSKTRRTIVIMVPREVDQFKMGYAILMYGTKDAAQSFDVASENVMTATSFTTDKFSPFLHHSRKSGMCVWVFSDGDDFCGVRHKTATKGVRRTTVQTYRAQQLETPKRSGS